jgi:hypothetical protein
MVELVLENNISTFDDEIERMRKGGDRILCTCKIEANECNEQEAKRNTVDSKLK